MEKIVKLKVDFAEFVPACLFNFMWDAMLLKFYLTAIKPALNKIVMHIQMCLNYLDCDVRQ